MDPNSPISLCMIVKDEEEWIKGCIESVHSIIREAIVVDTGSSDKTAEIARSLGARVFEYAWEEDFSKARNFSIAQATGAWILVLDADERIAAQDLPHLARHTQDRSVCTAFYQRHYTNDHRLSSFTPCIGEFPHFEQNLAGYFESACVRLFPNHEGIQFRYRVHELVEPVIAEIGKHQIRHARVRLHHFGHTPAVAAKKKKNTLYSPLGEAKAAEMPNDWKALFELGIEHNVNGRRRESIEVFRQSLALNPLMIDGWINCGYAHMEIGEYKEAMACYEQALKLDPRSAEACCNIGVVGMRTGNLKLAEDAALRALSINPRYVNVLLNLSRTYTMGQRHSEAVAVLQHTLRILPRCDQALWQLGAVYLDAGMLEHAAKYLKPAEALDHKDPSLHLNLGLLHRAQGDLDAARKSFHRFADVGGDVRALPDEIIKFMHP